jgi:hypothetical protein
MDTHATIEVLLETVLSTRSVKMGYKQDNRYKQVSSVREAVKRGLGSAEAEESPLLGAVIRERLLTTQQTGKYLACAMMIFNVWRLAMALLWLVVSSFV